MTADAPGSFRPGSLPSRWRALDAQHSAGTTSVLIVAGDEVFLRIVHSFLERSSYRLLAAADGDEALAIARAEMPHVVVIDDGLGGVDAAETCRRIKATAQARRLESPEVLVVCAEVDPATVQDGTVEEARETLADNAFDAGADSVVHRPLERARFLRIIAELSKAQPRRYFRLPAYLPATFRVGGGSDNTAGVRELSEGGAFLMTQEVLPPGTNVQVTLNLPPHGAVACWAQVATPPLENMSPGSDVGDPGMGVRFLNLGEHERDRVREYVQRFLASAGLLRGQVVEERVEKSPEKRMPPAKLMPYLTGAASIDTCLTALRGDGGGYPPGTGRYPAEPYPWEKESARAVADGEKALQPVARAAALRLVLEGWRFALLNVGLVPDFSVEKCLDYSRKLLERVDPALTALRGVASSSVGFVRPGEVALTRTRLYRASIALKQVAAELESDGNHAREPWAHPEATDWVRRLKEALHDSPPPELEATVMELADEEATLLRDWSGHLPDDDSEIVPRRATINLLGLRAWIDGYLHDMTIPLPKPARPEFLEKAAVMLAVAEASFREVTLRVAERVNKDGGTSEADVNALTQLDVLRFGTAVSVFALRDIYDLYRDTEHRSVFAPFENAESFHRACQAVERDGRVPANAWALAGEHALPPEGDGPFAEVITGGRLAESAMAAGS